MIRKRDTYGFWRSSQDTYPPLVPAGQNMHQTGGRRSKGPMGNKSGYFFFSHGVRHPRRRCTRHVHTTHFDISQQDGQQENTRWQRYSNGTNPSTQSCLFIQLRSQTVTTKNKFSSLQQGCGEHGHDAEAVEYSKVGSDVVQNNRMTRKSEVKQKGDGWTVQRNQQ